MKRFSLWLEGSPDVSPFCRFGQFLCNRFVTDHLMVRKEEEQKGDDRCAQRQAHPQKRKHNRIQERNHRNRQVESLAVQRFFIDACFITKQLVSALQFFRCGQGGFAAGWSRSMRDAYTLFDQVVSFSNGHITMNPKVPPSSFPSQAITVYRSTSSTFRKESATSSFCARQESRW